MKEVNTVEVYGEGDPSSYIALKEATKRFEKGADKFIGSIRKLTKYCSDLNSSTEKVEEESEEVADEEVVIDKEIVKDEIEDAEFEDMEEKMKHFYDLIDEQSELLSEQKLSEKAKKRLSDITSEIKQLSGIVKQYQQQEYATVQ